MLDEPVFRINISERKRSIPTVCLASPWARLGAYFVDSLIFVPINYFVQTLLLRAPSLSAQMQMSRQGSPWRPSLTGCFLSMALALFTYLALNYRLLKKGQTIGKFIFVLQIQRRYGGELFSVWELILKRWLPLQVSGFLGIITTPKLAGLIFIVDALCIFRKGSNTLHDDIAGSRVVSLPEGRN